jgi:VWFA-related protein
VLLSAQEPPATFSAGVKVVDVFASVRDKKGQIVTNLSQSDFALTEDGRPQTLRYFSRENNLPLTLGLLVDTSMSQQRVLGDERNASYRFLDKVLREDKDAGFLIHFDWQVELLQDLTPSRKKLDKALQLLETPEERRGRRRGGGTLLYDSVLLASDELMKKQTGRKALIILSDGVDRGSKVTLSRAVESALRSDTLVYSILFADEQQQFNRGFGGGGRHSGGRGRMPQSRPDGKKILEQISKQTGGRFFQVSKKQPIDKIYDLLQEELRSQYNLGYTPDKMDGGSGYRKIQLTLRQKDLVVQARDGYYADN